MSILKNTIVFFFVLAYSLAMGAFLKAGIAWSDAPIIFPLSLTAVFLLIGWRVDRRAAARKRREQPRAPRDWRVPGPHQIPPRPTVEVLPPTGSRSHRAVGRSR